MLADMVVAVFALLGLVLSVAVFIGWAIWLETKGR